jgi:hypothetical protein
LLTGGVNSQLPTSNSQIGPPAAPTSGSRVAPTSASKIAPTSASRIAPTTDKAVAPTSATLKDAFLAEVRAKKASFYNIVVAQAQRIDVTDEAITFTFSPTHRALREQFNETRQWLESAAQNVAGRRISVTAVQSEAGAAAPAPPKPELPRADAPVAASKRDLKAEAMSSSAVQAMLDVFPAEIRDVEEM